MNNTTEGRPEDYEKVVEDHIKYYARQVTINTYWHNGLQVVILLGSIALPFLIGNAGMVQEAHLPQWLPIVLSIFVAISAGIDGYFKFGETCAKFRTACQLITREQRWYKYGLKHYRELDTKEKRLQEFMQQVEEYMSDLYPSKKDRNPDETSSQVKGQVTSK